MNVKEQLKTDIERYKGLKTRGEKAAFVWDYYKYPLIALGTALVILALVIINNLDRVKTSMFMVMVNSDAAYVECDDSLIQAILTRSDYETGGKKIEINASYTIGSQGSVTSDLETIQVLTALFSISDLDVYIADREYFDYFATSLTTSPHKPAALINEIVPPSTAPAAAPIAKTPHPDI